MHDASLILLALALAGPAYADPPKGNPFDPSGYIDNKEAEKTVKSNALTTSSVFRINGLRYLKLASAEGVVYLPSDGTIPEFHEVFAICQQHLRLMREVLKMRENVPIDPEVKKHEPEVVDMIRKCKEGRIKGPTVVEEAPDGAQVEVKAKDHDERKGQGTPNSDNK